MAVFSSENKKVSLLIDIGSGSMTMSLVLFSYGEIPTFLYTLKRNFIIADKPDSFKLFDNMSSTLDEMLGILIKQGFTNNHWKTNKNNISDVLISFSSPWFLPKTKHVEISDDKSFIISKEFLASIISSEEKIFEEEIKNDGGGDDFEVIEKSIVHAKVNGYALSETVGQRTKKFDAFLCMSIISLNILDKVFTIILKNVHIEREKILVHTFPLISFSVLRDIFPSNQDFIILDTTSEVSDLTLVKADVITDTASFPSGRNFIIRQIATSFEVSVEIAESTLSLYMNGRLDNNSVVKTEEVLINVEKEWSIYFDRAIAEISKGGDLPKRIYITADKDVASIYTNFLGLSKADSTASLRKNLEIIPVTEELLVNLYKNDSITEPDEFVVILSIFYDKLYKK